MPFKDQLGAVGGWGAWLVLCLGKGERGGDGGEEGCGLGGDWLFFGSLRREGICLDCSVTFGYFGLHSVTMKEKKQKCKYCGGDLNARTTRREFCSNKCKVYWHRENKFEKEIEKILDNPKFKEIKKETLKQIIETGQSYIPESKLIEIAVTATGQQKITEYEEELKSVPDIGLGKKRRKYLENEIQKLKRQM